jgi:hypothetical protein
MRRPSLAAVSASQSVPVPQRVIPEHRHDQVERDLEPVGLLGVHRKTELALACLPGELDKRRQKLGEEAIARYGLEARMQRRKLDGNAGLPWRGHCTGRSRDRLDGVGVRRKVPLRIRARARAFSQHIERITQLPVRAGTLDRLLDGLSQHKVRAEEPHGLADGCAERGQTEALEQAVKDCVGRLSGMDDARAHSERPRGG